MHHPEQPFAPNEYVSLNYILFQLIEVCFKFNNCFTDLLNVSFNWNIVHPELKFVSMKRLLCQNSNNCFKQIEDCLKANVKRCNNTYVKHQKFCTRIFTECACLVSINKKGSRLRFYIQYIKLVQTKQSCI